MTFILPSFGASAIAAVPGGGGPLSVSFDGTNDYATISGSSELSISGDCSISAWFNPSSVSGFNYIFSLTDGRLAGTDRAFGLSGTQMVANTYASGWNDPFTHTAISTGSWYHVVVVFTSGQSRIYLNGSDLGTKSITTNTVSYTQTVIGGMLYSSGNHFNGLIDEVAVFNSELSSSQITNIYKGEEDGGSGGTNGVPGSLSTFNPVGWWRMGDGSDGSGNADGTLVNIGGTDFPQIYNVAKDGSGNRITGIDGSLTNGPTFSSDVPS